MTIYIKFIIYGWPLIPTRSVIDSLSGHWIIHFEQKASFKHVSQGNFAECYPDNIPE